MIIIIYCIFSQRVWVLKENIEYFEEMRKKYSKTGEAGLGAFTEQCVLKLNKIFFK
jgi:hypothetical protein